MGCKYEVRAKNYPCCERSWETINFTDDFDKALKLFLECKNQYDYVEFICRN
jgi:hypothetical protein